MQAAESQLEGCQSYHDCGAGSHLTILIVLCNKFDIVALIFLVAFLVGAILRSLILRFAEPLFILADFLFHLFLCVLQHLLKWVFLLLEAKSILHLVFSGLRQSQIINSNLACVVFAQFDSVLS